MPKGKDYPDELKAAVLSDYNGGMTAVETAKKHGVNTGNVYSWNQQKHGSRAKKKKGTSALVPVNGKLIARNKFIPGTKIAATSLDAIKLRIRGVYIHLERGNARLIRDIQLGKVSRIAGPHLDLINALAELTEADE